MYSILRVMAEMVGKKLLRIRHDDVNNANTYSSRFECIATL